jgi:hypothetical protein
VRTRSRPEGQQFEGEDELGGAVVAIEDVFEDDFDMPIQPGRQCRLPRLALRHDKGDDRRQEARMPPAVVGRVQDRVEERTSGILRLVVGREKRFEVGDLQEVGIDRVVGQADIARRRSLATRGKVIGMRRW